MANTKIRGDKQIIAGTITNTEISSGAAIALSKLAEAVLQADGGQALTADWNVGSYKISSSATPESANDFTSKSYVDSLVTGLKWRKPVCVLKLVGNATVATINGLGTVAGDAYVVTDAGQLTRGTLDVVAGDLVEDNGTIWVKIVSGVGGYVASGTRAVLAGPSDTALISPYTDNTDNGKIVSFSGSSNTGTDTSEANDGSAVLVCAEGSLYENSGYVFDGTVSTGEWTQFTGAGQINAGTGLTKVGNTINVGTSTSIGGNENSIYVNTDGINDTHIDWGTGANQVSMDDVPDGTTYGKVVLTSMTSGEVVKLTDSGGDDLTVALGGGNRVLTLNEALTVGDGANVTITAEDNATAVVMDNANFEVENLNVTQRSLKLSVGTDANAALSVEGTSGAINQDVTSDASPTFVTVYGTTFDTNVVAAGVTLTGTTLSADGTDENISVTITPKGTGSVIISKVDINGGTVDACTLGTASAITEAQIDNININGNAITSTDVNGDISLTPNGTGEVNISKVDIDAGTIDGCNITVGASKTLDVSAGTFTVGLGAGTAAMRRMVVREVPNESPDNSTTAFTVDYTPISGSDQVFLNGILQNSGGGNDYTLAGSTFTFTSAPEVGDVILVSYLASN